MGEEFIDKIPAKPSSMIMSQADRVCTYSTSKLIDDITNFYDVNDISHKPDLLHGLTKASTDFAIDSYIKTQLMLIQKVLLAENPDKTLIIKSYFDTLCKMIDMLKALDLNVAVNQILADNIGYLMSNIKRVYKTINE